MYKFSSKLKNASFALMIIGLILYAIGFVSNYSKGENEINSYMKERPELFAPGHAGSDHHNIDPKDHKEHMEHMEHQLHNKPWTALYVPAFLFTGIALAALFFLSIQHVAQAGWPVIITRVMEGVASFLPYGLAILAVIFIGALNGFNHIFHWMDCDLVDRASPHYDKMIDAKSTFLNKNMFIFTSVLYSCLWLLFLNLLKAASKRLDKDSTHANYMKLYNTSVVFIVIFALSSMSIAWYWVMSIDPHWFSTFFGWYMMVSYLVSFISVTILICIYLKKAGYLPLFNDNHLHDLSKFMFGFSMLWTYTWFFQFMLYFYSDIPEEVVYYMARYDLYKPTFFFMLFPNFFIPLFVLLSSSMKRSFKVVPIIAVIIILGHYLDIYNAMMPGTVGPFWSFGLPELGALLFVVGIFIFVVFSELTKLNLEPRGNPLFHESEIYEYPF